MKAGKPATDEPWREIFLFVAIGAVIAALVTTFWRYGPYGLLAIIQSISGLAAGVALVVLIAALLIALVVWLTKRQRTPRGQATGGTGASAATYAKRSYGWLWTILVIAAIGLVGWQVILPKIPPPTAASQGYPICADARDTTLTPEDGITIIGAQMNPNCWSGWIATPADWSDYYFQAVENRGMEIWFLDGSRYWLKPNSFPWFPNKRGIFRVRGEGELIVSIEGGPEDTGDEDFEVSPDKE